MHGEEAWACACGGGCVRGILAHVPDNATMGIARPITPPGTKVAACNARCASSPFPLLQSTCLFCQGRPSSASHPRQAWWADQPIRQACRQSQTLPGRCPLQHASPPSHHFVPNPCPASQLHLPTVGSGEHGHQPHPLPPQAGSRQEPAPRLRVAPALGGGGERRHPHTRPPILSVGVPSARTPHT